MNTLMSEETFGDLRKARDSLVAAGEDMAGIFIPWAGPELLRSGGIYYVGQGTRGWYGSDQSQTMEVCYKMLSDIERGELKEHTLFWKFLNRLSIALLGRPSQETAQRWGWSNMLKIGCRTNNAQGWPARAKDWQRDICIRALKEEFARLRHALIFIASNETFGVLEHCVPNWEARDKSQEEHGVHSQWDGAASNLYVNGYHPRAASQQCFLDAQLRVTLNLAKRFAVP